MGLSRPRFSITKPDGTLKSAAELQEEADRLILGAQARTERLREAVAANIVEATSRNRAATVTVVATGALQSIRLNDRIQGMGAAMVAESIMEAYREASRQAVARTTEIAGEEIGEERARTMMTELLPDYAMSDQAAGGRS
jgi:DNA-binding protein YbaB